MEIQRLKGAAVARRIPLRDNEVGSKAHQCADAIRFALEDRAAKIACRDPSAGRRPEWEFVQPERLFLLRAIKQAIVCNHPCRRRDGPDISSNAINCASQRIERRDRALRHSRVRVLPYTCPGVIGETWRVLEEMAEAFNIRDRKSRNF